MAFLDFYDHLVVEMQGYLVALLPFDVFLVGWQYVGLCLLWVGELKYIAIMEVLYHCLEHLLLRTVTVVEQGFLSCFN